jgi:hypothetical protein
MVWGSKLVQKPIQLIQCERSIARIHRLALGDRVDLLQGSGDDVQGGDGRLR